MRITGGELRSRIIQAAEGVRPAADRVREAVFSSLYSQIALESCLVLDLYAGSGSYGIEAISRGAAFSVFVEANRNAAKVLQDNLSTLGLGTQGLVLNCSVEDSLSQLQTYTEGQERAFDLVFIDPPYVEHPGSKLLAGLVKYKLVSERTLIIVESDTELEIEDKIHFEAQTLLKFQTKDYGSTRISYFGVS